MEPVKISQSSNRKISTISHALSILNDAADDSAEEIRELVRTDVRDLKQIFAKLNPEFREAVGEIKKATLDTLNQAKDKTVSAAKTVDSSVHESPWGYLGGLAATSVAVGFLLGRRVRQKGMA